MKPPRDKSREEPTGDKPNARPRRRSSKRFEKFRCARCGRCCIGDGFVNVDEEECDLIAEFLGLTGEEFRKRYTIKEDGFDRYLVDGEGDEVPCVFLQYEGNGLAACRIEPVKPRQCREFPFKWRRPDMVRWCRALQEED